MVHKDTFLKLGLSAIFLIICSLLFILFIQVKFLRIMADEKYFLYFAYSGLTELTEFKAAEYPYAAFSKLHVFLLSLFNLKDLKEVVYGSKLFSSIPLFLVFFGLIYSFFCYSKKPWDIWFFTLVSLIILLVFSTTGRIVECRPDALSIPLYCAANLIICYRIKRSKTWHLDILAGILLIFTAWISIRAAIIILVMLPIYIYILRGRFSTEPRHILSMMCIFIGFIIMLIIGFNINPIDIVSLMRSPEASLARTELSFKVKILQPNRLTLLAFQMLIGILAILIIKTSNCKAQRSIGLLGLSLIIVQFIFIVLDPAPFLYSYSYGLSGVLVVIVAILDMPKLKGVLLMLSISLGGLQSMHVLAAKNYHFGRSIHAAPIKNIDVNYQDFVLPDLLDIYLKSGQWHTKDQIAIRQVLCNKIKGKLISRFSYQPICIAGALDIESYTIFMTNPKINREEPVLNVIIKAIKLQDTEVIIWGRHKLNPHIYNTLDSLPDWTLYNGFALRDIKDK